MYSGELLKNKMERQNIKKGPTIQVINNEMKSNFTFLNTKCIFSNRTFKSGGYIISINPIAKGILVVPLEKELIIVEEEGIKYPMPTPKNMAKNIHRVRYLSKKPSSFFGGIVKF